MSCRPHSFRRSGLAALLLALPALAQAAYTVSIDAPAGLASLLQDNLDLITQQQEADADAGLLEALLRSAPEDARALLETEGYFQAQVTVEKTGERQYKVTVKPGQPVLVDDVTLRLEGEIRADDDFQQRMAKALELWTLPIGAPYRQSEWDAGKRAVLRSLMVDRYPKARIARSEARIDPASGKAELTVTLDSGPRIAFGDITVKGMRRYPESLAKGLADFQPGSPYRQQKLLDYQAALEQSPYFSSVIVSPDLEHIDGNRAPVDVDVVELARQKLELGLTYDSDLGPGVRLGYDHYNIFKRGFTGSTLIDWQRDKQSVAFGLGFPRAADGYSHSITSSFKSENIQGVKTDTLDAGAWRIRTRGNIEARLGVEYLMEREEAGGLESRNTHVTQLVYGWTQRAVDDLMRPRNGYLLDTRLSGTLGVLGSSTSLVRGYARAVAYWSPFPKYGTFVGRLELGQVWAQNLNDVPSALRFRAGGANSVRGYEYQSLGLPGPNGSVLGGNVVATGSLEYQIPIKPDWYLALFTDAGNAADGWANYQAERSNGVGVRWMSPVAPLSFDVAKAEKDGKIRWNLSLGLAF
ncbi:hypothetical protein CEK28_13530 [Xenophilus sp. AP218F]|nr:hypothetical protein CEK28_13530 [Xenophilus sp. AP218F]